MPDALHPGKDATCPWVTIGLRQVRERDLLIGTMRQYVPQSLLFHIGENASRLAQDDFINTQNFRGH